MRRLGLYLTTFYAVIVIAVYLYTAANTKPGNVGYDWIPFIMLALPWYLFGSRFLVPGLLLNWALSYCVGFLLQKAWQRAFPVHQPDK